MTQIDRGAYCETASAAAIRQELEAAGALPPGTWISAVVVLVQTERVGEDGIPTYAEHRVYPAGPVNPAMERGMIINAWEQTRARRS